MSHTTVLVVAYGVVCLTWLAVSRWLPYWRTPQRPSFARPWLELGCAAIAIVLVLLLGQAYTHGIRLPGHGPWRPLTESINQLVIFSPIVLLPVARGQGWDSAWLPRKALVPRLAIGVGLSLIALTIHAALEGSIGKLPPAVAGVYSLRNAHIAVQVLLEDVAIAILLARLGRALTARWAILGTACLFALAHVPTMLAEGAHRGRCSDWPATSVSGCWCWPPPGAAPTSSGSGRCTRSWI